MAQIWSMPASNIAGNKKDWMPPNGSDMAGSDMTIMSGGKREQFRFVYVCQDMLHCFRLQKSV